MNTLILGPLDDYELIDSGGGEKLERFGQYLLRRPDSNAIWNKQMSQAEWSKADATFHASPSPRVNQGKHWENRNVKEPWKFTFDNLSMWLHLTPFKHTGLFPEQILNWEWFGKKIEEKSGATPAKILNLFGYTGGATLYSALKGASVTHVDASKPSVNWAIENQKLSGLEKASIRWIVDDAKKFVAREIKRGNLYDGVILDPPAFGRDPKGKVFKFEENVPELLKLVKDVLSLEPLFVLLNSYATGYSPEVVKNMFVDVFPQEKIKCGELAIKEKNNDRRLPTGIFARFE